MVGDELLRRKLEIFFRKLRIDSTVDRNERERERVYERVLVDERAYKGMLVFLLRISMKMR